MTVTTSASPSLRLSLKKEQFRCVGLGAIVFAYFFPKLSLFNVLCGIYDVSRHRPLTGFVLRQYLVGNGVGVPTWYCPRSIFRA